jgi:molybdopterin/thiamine biosynthesis adenylyltransferase
VKITKRIREEAALICAIAACEPASQHGVRGWRAYYDCIASDLDVMSESQTLALAAWRHACPLSVQWTPEMDAEAEAMLRTGWQP